MAEAALALSTAAPDLTGQVCVDQPVLDRLGITVKTLDGTREFSAR